MSSIPLYGNKEDDDCVTVIFIIKISQNLTEKYRAFTDYTQWLFSSLQENNISVEILKNK